MCAHAPICLKALVELHEMSQNIASQSFCLVINCRAALWRLKLQASKFTQVMLRLIYQVRYASVES